MNPPLFYADGHVDAFRAFVPWAGLHFSPSILADDPVASRFLERSYATFSGG
jgi:hypothetical protein